MAAPARTAPVSFAQEQMWFFCRFHPESPLYNYSVGAYRLTGTVNPLALQQGVQEIVRRHEILRTTFHQVGGRLVQSVSADRIQTLEIVSLRGIVSSERQAAVRRIGEEMAVRPFDLEAGPLVRLSLLELREGDYVVLFGVHHIISDGWSQGIWARELEQLSRAFLAGEPSPLPELTLQYADYALRERERWTGPRLEEHLSFWKERLRGAPAVLELVGDHPRPAVQNYRGSIHARSLSEELSDAVKQLSRRQGVTLYATLLAAFKVLLYQNTHQGDIVVGTPVANRRRSDERQLIGILINLVVLRTRLSAHSTFSDLVSRVQAGVLEALERSELPYPLLVNALAPRRSLSHQPVVQALFVFQNTTPPAIRIPHAVCSAPEEFRSGTAVHDLVLNVRCYRLLPSMEMEPQILMHWEYNQNLFEEPTIHVIADQYEAILRHVVRTPADELSRLATSAEPCEGEASARRSAMATRLMAFRPRPLEPEK